MKRTVIGTATIALVVVSAAILLHHGRLKEYEFSLGYVIVGARCPKEITLTNPFNKPLQVDKVKVSNPSLLASLDNHDYKEDQNITVSLVFIPPANNEKHMNLSIDLISDSHAVIRLKLNYCPIKAIPYEYGTVFPNKTYIRTIHLDNPIKRNIQIASIKTSCGCVESKVDRDIWNADDKANVSVGLLTSEMSGRMVEQVYIFGRSGSDDVVLALEIHADVKSPFSMVQLANGIDLGTIDVRRDETTAVRLGFERGDHPVQWDRVIASSKDGLFIPEIEKSDNKWILSCSPVIQRGLLGSYHDMLSLTPSQGNAKIDYEMKVPVHITYAGPLLFAPQSILLDNMILSRPSEALISVRINGTPANQAITDGNLSVTEIKFDDGSPVEWKIAETSQREIKIKIIFRPMVEGRFNRDVMIGAKWNNKAYCARIALAGFVNNSEKPR